ncbi:hypothetical protein NDU88_004186 [Pleurodeles waltl]|uniref:Uncharacterized protein n=1 Tax=Pleurodeles waltl TaxID=8319 RepID=A0AAV7KX19_PLEWA|nr:hypothetical protein NDU88_004186 [Pleurodeles waltl]
MASGQPHESPLSAPRYEEQNTSAAPPTLPGCLPVSRCVLTARGPTHPLMGPCGKSHCRARMAVAASPSALAQLKSKEGRRARVAPAAGSLRSLPRSPNEAGTRPSAISSVHASTIGPARIRQRHRSLRPAVAPSNKGKPPLALSSWSRQD